MALPIILRPIKRRSALFGSTSATRRARSARLAASLGETAVTHTIQNDPSAPRDALEKPREMMETWAEYFVATVADRDGAANGMVTTIG